MGARQSTPHRTNLRSTVLSMLRSAGKHSFNDEAVLSTATKVVPDDAQWDGDYRRGIATSDEYQHYMPPNMPLCPVYQTTFVQECNRSWKIICKASTPKMKSYNKEGIVLFYDEFFHRLFQRDPGFNDIFPGIRRRIEVLIKAMKFLLNDSGVPEAQVISRCRNLGYRHRTIPKVRPHHFSAYASTFVEVAMFWLDVEATPDVGEAWSNVVGFNLKYMLQAYLYNNVDESEWNQNIIVPQTTAEQNNKETAANKKEKKKHKKKEKPPPKKQSQASQRVS